MSGRITRSVGGPPPAAAAAPVHVPPQNIEAEESVLGAMLVAQPAIKRVRADVGLVGAHFYLDKHRLIFEALCTVADRTGTADELLVTEELIRRGKIELAGGKHYVSELAAKVPAAGNAAHYAEVVLLNAQLRAKLLGGQLIQGGVFEDDPERGAEMIREGLELATADFTVDSEVTSGEAILSELFDYFYTQEEGDVFELPWPDLNDCVIGGFRRKQMSVLAGWTGMGKSWVLDQMLAAFTAQGYKCGLFATEMGREERAARWLTSETAVPLEKIMRNRLEPKDMKRLLEAANEHNALPFDYFEAFDWSADQIAERAMYGDYDVVAIDPITEIPGFEKTELASAITRRLARLASRAECHVIAVAHLNRNRLRDPKGVKPRPLCLDLKGSGALETLAHAVLFLHRKQDDEANVLPEGELYFDKVRNGLKKSLPVYQNSRTHRFFRLTPPPKHEQSELEVGVTHIPPGHDRESEDF